MIDWIWEYLLHIQNWNSRLYWRISNEIQGFSSVNFGCNDPTWISTQPESNMHLLNYESYQIQLNSRDKFERRIESLGRRLLDRGSVARWWFFSKYLERLFWRVWVLSFSRSFWKRISRDNLKKLVWNSDRQQNFSFLLIYIPLIN